MVLKNTLTVEFEVHTSVVPNCLLKTYHVFNENKICSC